MAKVDNLEVQYLPVDALTPYARNSRTHDDAQVAQLAASIKEFGFTNPVLVDEEGGIIAGHGRVLAAQRLKLQTVPCITLAGLTEAQKRAYVIADNRLPMNAGWDSDMLAVELDELKGEGFDIDLLGFTPKELNDLIGTPNLGPEPEEGAEKDVNFTIQYNIIFDNVDQQERWFGFIKYLKARYPHDETLGERLMKFIREGGYATS